MAQEIQERCADIQTMLIEIIDLPPPLTSGRLKNTLAVARCRIARCPFLSCPVCRRPRRPAPANAIRRRLTSLHFPKSSVSRSRTLSSLLPSFGAAAAEPLTSFGNQAGHGRPGERPGQRPSAPISSVRPTEMRRRRRRRREERLHRLRAAVARGGGDVGIQVGIIPLLRAHHPPSPARASSLETVPSAVVSLCARF